MTVELTRAQLFSRGVKGGAALLVAGSAASLLAPVAAADPLSDNDLAYVRLLVGTELLGIDFYSRAIDAKKLSATGQKYLKAALANEKEHYQSVAGILERRGARTRCRRRHRLRVSERPVRHGRRDHEARGQARDRVPRRVPGRRRAACSRTCSSAGSARIAANQAQHLSVFQNMLFGKPINVSFPQAMSIQSVSDVMDTFTA